MASRIRIPILLGLASLSGLAASLVSLTQPGCTGSECTYDKRRPDTPSMSLECGAGNVCYLGAFVRSCNSGAERRTPCDDDGDCKDPSLPNCVGSDALSGNFCSTCDDGESCVVGLNVCRVVTEIPDPDEPATPLFEPPPLPLDAGPLDAVTFEKEDEEEEPTSAVETHVGSVVLGEFVNLVDNERTPFACADFADVRGADLVTNEVVIGSGFGACDLVQPRLYRARGEPAAESGLVSSCERREPTPQYPRGVVAADIGKILFSAHMDTTSALAREVNLTFSGASARYLVTPSSLPEPLLTLSQPRMGSNRSVEQYVKMKGDPVPGLTQAWPSVQQGGQIHVPYELRLSPDTEDRLGRVIEVGSPPQDIKFTWQLLDRITEVGGERVLVRIYSDRAPYVFISCESSEQQGTAPEIVIFGQLLQSFREASGVASGTELRIEISRSLVQRLDIPSDAVDAGVPDASASRPVVNGRLRIAHGYLGTVRF